jgi:hypothetical protein
VGDVLREALCGNMASGTSMESWCSESERTVSREHLSFSPRRRTCRGSGDNRRNCGVDQFFGCGVTCAGNDKLSCEANPRCGPLWADDDQDSGLEEDDWNLDDSDQPSWAFPVLSYGGLSGMSKKPAGVASIEEALQALKENAGNLFAEGEWDVTHKCGDRYTINSRTIRIFLLPKGTTPRDFSHISRIIGAGPAEQASRIMVHDGPLKQPLLDYLMQTGLNEHYDRRGTENPVAVTGKARYMEFAVPAKAMADRQEAMRHAAAQADARRRTDAAERFNIFPGASDGQSQGLRVSQRNFNTLSG